MTTSSTTEALSIVVAEDGASAALLANGEPQATLQAAEGVDLQARATVLSRQAATAAAIRRLKVATQDLLAYFAEDEREILKADPSLANEDGDLPVMAEASAAVADIP